MPRQRKTLHPAAAVPLEARRTRCMTASRKRLLSSMVQTRRGRLARRAPLPARRPLLLLGAPSASLPSSSGVSARRPSRTPQPHQLRVHREQVRISTTGCQWGACTKQGSTFVRAFAAAVGSAGALVGVAPFTAAAGAHALCWALRRKQLSSVT